MEWKENLNKFLNDFEHSEDVIGILVCGSFITGQPSQHSDLDVHIVLNESVKYRERGNKIVDGLLIEYFSNSPAQIRKYFKEDYSELSLMSPTQFATGLIIEDKTGEVQKLKDEAIELIKLNFINVATPKINELQKYGVWDMLDDLEDALERKRKDFDFLYYNNLNKLLNEHMKILKHPYHRKTIVGNITSEIVRKKYLLKEIPDPELAKTIYCAITKKCKKARLKNYKKLTQMFFDKTGGFNIDGFVFKSNPDI